MGEKLKKNWGKSHFFGGAINYVPDRGRGVQKLQKNIFFFKIRKIVTMAKNINFEKILSKRGVALRRSGGG